MGDIADKLMDWMQTNVPQAMEIAGDLLVEETRDEISEPYPPSSTPLTPPHSRKGFLRDDLHIQRDASPASVQDTFVSARRFEPHHVGVPAMLEKGTAKMEPRPYMGTLRERVIAFYLEDVTAELRSRLAK